MRQTWPQALKLVRASEGGNDDDPDDPGGRTSRGITQREYTAWRAARGEPAKDVWTASDEEVDAIYHDQYWNPWCDMLPVGVDYVFFDEAVNTGMHQTILFLQRALGVTADGHIGVVTKAALAQSNPTRLILAMTDEKEAFYKSLRTFWKYGRGWLARNKTVEQAALKMVATA